MKKIFVAIVAGIALLGVLAVGCEKKKAEDDQAGQKQTEQTPSTEKTKEKSAPVGC